MKNKKPKKSQSKTKGGKGQTNGAWLTLEQMSKKDREYVLKQASVAGDIDVAKRVLRMGANPNCGAKQKGHLPLINASYYGHVEIVRLLLASGAHVNLADAAHQRPLLMAAMGGSTHVVAELLKAGANVHLSGQTGCNALMEACKFGHPKIVAMLLERGADINGNVPGVPTPLSIAMMNGHTEVVRMLLDKGVEIERSGSRSISALTEASIRGELEMAKMLFDYGANPSPKYFDVPPLWAAACNGHLEVVDELLRHDASIDIFDRMLGRTPLMIACSGARTEIAQRLIDHGANPNLEDSDGQTALFYAVQQGTPETVRLLLEGGARVNHRYRDGDTALTVACTNGHAEVVEMLLRAGARPDEALPDGTLPLEIAKEEGHSRVVEILKRHGAIDPAEQAREKKEWQELVTTEFFQSVRSGNLNSIDAALSAGADTNCTNPEGETALMIAVERGDKKVVSYLISKGADVNASHLRSGHTALDKALHKRRDDLFDLLLKEGAEVEQRMLSRPAGKGNAKWVKKLLSAGCTADGDSLLAAVKNGHIQVVQLLLSKGAPPDTWDCRARATALMIAARKGRSDIVRCLLGAGADPNLIGHNRSSALMEAVRARHSDVVQLLIDGGADLEIKDGDGRTALDLAKQPEIKEILRSMEAKRHH